MEDLQVQFSKPDTITEEDLIEHVLGNLPSVYDIEVRALRKKLDDTANPLTIEEVCEESSLKFEMMIGKKRLCSLEVTMENVTPVENLDTVRVIVNTRIIMHRTRIYWKKNELRD